MNAVCTLDTKRRKQFVIMNSRKRVWNVGTAVLSSVEKVIMRDVRGTS